MEGGGGGGGEGGGWGSEGEWEGVERVEENKISGTRAVGEKERGGKKYGEPFSVAGKRNDHEGTRTLNLLIRSQTPYPLGHAVQVHAPPPQPCIICLLPYLTQLILSFCSLIYQILPLSEYSSLCLVLSLSARPPARPPACLPVCLPAYLPACLPACPPACPPARPPACPLVS